MATMRSIGMRARAAISGETRTSYLRSRSESRSLGSLGASMEAVIGYLDEQDPDAAARARSR
jgi:hypothetical protein